MGMFWYLVIIMVCVFVHELGHYIAAKRQGVGVKNFAVGFGPTVIQWDYNNTTWRINMLPLGGYAEIEGMQPGDRFGYATLSALGKFWILAAGVLVNLAVCWLSMFVLGVGWGHYADNKVQINSVEPQSIAQKVGLQAGDVVTSIDQKAVSESNSFNQLKKVKGNHTLEVVRAGQPTTININWTYPEKTLIGVRLGGVREKVSALESAKAASRFFLLVPQALSQTVSGFVKVLLLQKDTGLTGPIANAQAAGEAARSGPDALLSMFAMFNFSVAIFNILPIPGLDGGRILILILNKLSGGRIGVEQEAKLIMGGFVILIMSYVLVIWQDLKLLG